MNCVPASILGSLENVHGTLDTLQPNDGRAKCDSLFVVEIAINVGATRLPDCRDALRKETRALPTRARPNHRERRQRVKKSTGKPIHFTDLLCSVPVRMRSLGFFNCRDVLWSHNNTCNIPLSDARKKALSIPSPIAPNDVTKSRSGKSGLPIEIITRPNPVFSPTTPPENKPMVAPKISRSFVVDVLPVTSRVPPTATVQSRKATPKKKISIPSLPCILNVHASRPLATHRNKINTTSFMLMLSPLHNDERNRATACDIKIQRTPGSAAPVQNLASQLHRVDVE